MVVNAAEMLLVQGTSSHKAMACPQAFTFMIFFPKLVHICWGLWNKVSNGLLLHRIIGHTQGPETPVQNGLIPFFSKVVCPLVPSTLMTPTL